MSWNQVDKRFIKAARKKHICTWCAEPIEMGQPYHRYAGTWEGQFHSNPMHPECDDAFDRSYEGEYTLYEHIRGISMEEREVFDEGCRAFESEQDRTPPNDMSAEDAAIWLQGFDAEKADFEDRKSKVTA